MNDMWIAFFPFAFFFLWFFFVVLMVRRKNCPVCNQPLPRIQSPFTKSKRQFWEGGYLCPHCGCETDLEGRQVALGTAPERRSIVLGIGMVMFAMIPAVVLLVLLFQR